MNDTTLPPIVLDTENSSNAINRFGCIYGSGDWNKPYQWLIKNLIPDNAVGFIGGSAASGKTFAAIEIMGAVISGQAAFGQFEVMRSGIVLYCAVEGRQGIAHRFEAYRQSREIDDAIWSSRLVQSTELFRFIDTNPKEFVHYVREIEAALDDKVALVVFDTLRTFGGIGDENGSTDAQEALSWMRRVSLEADCSTLAIHHAGKNSDNPIRPGDDFNRVLRGSSDFGSSAEYVIGVAQAKSSDGETISWVWVAKLKDVKPELPIPAPIESYLLHIDDHEPVSVGVIAKDIDNDIELAEKVINPKPGQPRKDEEDARHLAEYVRRGTASATLTDLRNELKRYLETQGVDNDNTINSRRRKALEELRKNPERYGVKWTAQGELQGT